MHDQDEAFPDRRAAGRDLAVAVTEALTRRGEAVVLGLPRGGVPVAAPVAASLGAQLDVLVVRKLGLPAQPELAMGAIAGVGGAVEIVRNERVLTQAAVSAELFDAVLAVETAELQDREQRYRSAPAVSVTDRIVVLVDDGLATGSTMRAAIATVSRQRPASIVVAAPVGAPSTCDALAREVDLLVCLRRPPDFRAVGQAYVDFAPTADEEVRSLLAAGASAWSV